MFDETLAIGELCKYIALSTKEITNVLQLMSSTLKMIEISLGQISDSLEKR